jgi:hypothetical protein
MPPPAPGLLPGVKTDAVISKNKTLTLIPGGYQTSRFTIFFPPGPVISKPRVLDFKHKV